MTLPPLLTIVLAAGKGTRMKSRVPKVLHRIGGLSMLGHVLATARAAGSARVAVVVGPDMDAVAEEARRHVPDAEIFLQTVQAGTADAVRAAEPAIRAHAGDIVVMYADTPLIEPQTIERLRLALADGAGVGVLGFRPADPTGYGRLLTEADGRLVAIREEKDATEAERSVGLCNSGVMAFRLADPMAVLSAIGNANAKGEYYLTDAVEIAGRAGIGAAVAECPEAEVMGVNARDQLAAAEALWQDRRRKSVMAEGATLVAPETVWLSFDTKIGRDVLIEPNVFIGPGVTIEDGVEIKANCHLEGAYVRSGVRLGPFARLRPGADLGANVHVGNFVEVKNVKMADGAKANHLAYLGDGRVGVAANIGAGTIFCNYDGFNKNITDVGDGAFVGSNSALVAPVRIGNGAYVGSGSVITRNVPDNALALERNQQDIREGWAEKFRALMTRQKAAKSKS